MGATGFLTPNEESTFFQIFNNFGQPRLTIGTNRDGNGGALIVARNESLRSDYPSNCSPRSTHPASAAPASKGHCRRRFFQTPGLSKSMSIHAQQRSQICHMGWLEAGAGAAGQRRLGGYGCPHLSFLEPDPCRTTGQ
ncbi:hypothetical protein FHX08_001118 [Rhizobium sp. BK529]|uniref:hypothetical protein n=1 Tax=unclassified Rhizobium TaxID=2613769 RepID=UPI00104D3389|nr:MULTISPECIES: hypothetical protein [unclassified Rhizobium]MBB3590774.1 hypothetical protein [Rhizobium sp. BK529]